MYTVRLLEIQMPSHISAHFHPLSLDHNLGMLGTPVVLGIMVSRLLVFSAKMGMGAQTFPQLTF